MNNALVALDMLATGINIISRVQELLKNAELEGREVSDEELQALQVEIDFKRAEWDKLTRNP